MDESPDRTLTQPSTSGDRESGLLLDLQPLLLVLLGLLEVQSLLLLGLLFGLLHLLLGLELLLQLGFVVVAVCYDAGKLRSPNGFRVVILRGVK